MQLKYRFLKIHKTESLIFLVFSKVKFPFGSTNFEIKYRSINLRILLLLHSLFIY